MESNFSFNSQPKKENTNIKDYFNIVIIGDSSVGKTSILEKYINNAFEPNPKGKKLIEIYKKKNIVSSKLLQIKILGYY